MIKKYYFFLNLLWDTWFDVIIQYCCELLAVRSEQLYFT